MKKHVGAYLEGCIASELKLGWQVGRIQVCVRVVPACDRCGADIGAGDGSRGRGGTVTACGYSMRAQGSRVRGCGYRLRYHVRGRGSRVNRAPRTCEWTSQPGAVHASE